MLDFSNFGFATDASDSSFNKKYNSATEFDTRQKQLQARTNEIENQITKKMRSVESQLKITRSCFDKCVDFDSLDVALSEKQQVCIYRCTQRIMEIDHFLGRRFTALGEKYQQEGYGNTK